MKNEKIKNIKTYRDPNFMGWYVIKKSKESGKLYKNYILSDKMLNRYLTPTKNN